MGPEAPYFMAVEGHGSRYLIVSAASWAHWARWVPLLEHNATTVARPFLTAQYSISRLACR